MRAQIIEDGVRVDGRQLDEVRPISCRVGVLPRRVHGSGLFNRGLTQVLSIATLAPPVMLRIWGTISIPKMKSAIFITIISHPFPSVKPVPCVLPAVEKSVTVL